MKKLVSLLLAAAMVLALAACGGNTETTKAPETSKPAESTKAPESTQAPETTTEPAPATPKIMKLSSDNCLTFNPYLANSTEDAYNAWCQARLYRTWVNEKGEKYVRDELADGFPVKKDTEGKVWWITLKDGICFDDGTPITADTFMYSFKMALDPVLKQRAGDNYNIYITILNAHQYWEALEGSNVSWEDVGIKKVDDKTIEITTEVAASELLVAKAFMGYGQVPVDPDLFEAGMSADRTTCTYGTDHTKVKYCGAFKVVDWVKESNIVVEKNQNYVYADEIALDGAELIYIDNAQTKVEMFEAGELDRTGINAEVGVQYVDSPDYFTSPSRYLMMIEINDNSCFYKPGEKKGDIVKVENNKADLAQPILSNMNFKNAMWYAVDRVTLAKLECGDPANFIIPYTSFCGEDSNVRFRDTDAAKAYVEDINESYNPEKAKEYFEKALEEEKMDKVELKIVLSSSNAEMSICANFLAEQFNKIFDGKFILTLDEMPSSSRLEAMKGWRTSLNSYELGLANWSRSVTDASPFNQMDVFSSSYYTKVNAPYHCETVEKLIWLQDTDPAVKADIDFNVKMAAEMEKAALEDRVVIPLFERTSQYLVHENCIPNCEDPTNWIGWLFDMTVD